MNTPTVGQLKGLVDTAHASRDRTHRPGGSVGCELEWVFLARSGVGLCTLETTENSRCARPKSSAKR